MLLVTYLAAAVAFSVIAVAAATFVWVLFSEGRTRHREVASLQRGVGGAFLGNIPTDVDGIKDPRVAKGFVYNKSTKKLEGQGKLSDEYVSALLGK